MRIFLQQCHEIVPDEIVPIKLKSIFSTYDKYRTAFSVGFLA